MSTIKALTALAMIGAASAAFAGEKSNPTGPALSTSTPTIIASTQLNLRPLVVADGSGTVNFGQSLRDFYSNSGSPSPVATGQTATVLSRNGVGTLAGGFSTGSSTIIQGGNSIVENPNLKPRVLERNAN